MDKQKRIDWLKDRISSMEQCRDEMPFGLSEDEYMELSAYKDSLTSLMAEPVAYLSKGDLDNGEHHIIARKNKSHACTLAAFTAPPVPEIKFPDRDKLPGWARNHDDSLDWYEAEIKRLNGWGK